MTKVRIALMRGNAEVEPMVIWYTNEIYAERKYLSNNKARENRVKRIRKKRIRGIRGGVATFSSRDTR
jgi:hypothetical protein